MEYPAIIDFKFDIDNTYVIPSNLVGNPGLISYQLYENVNYYKPLCYANDVIISIGTRLGIRSEEEAYRKDLLSSGYTPSQINEEIEKYRSETIYSDYDWVKLGNTMSGYITDLYEGRTLLVPSVESCRRWLGLYGDRNRK